MAETYQVRIHRPLQDPLLCLVLEAALTVNTSLNPDVSGL